MKTSVRFAALALVMAQVACSSAEDSTAATTAVIDFTGQWEWTLGKHVGGVAGGEFQTIEVPANLSDLEELKDYTGHVTLRRQLPDELAKELAAGQPVAFFSGQVSDVFQVYLNAEPVARRGSEEPHQTASYRIALTDLPGSALRAGGPNYIQIVAYTNGQYPLHLYGPEMLVGPAGQLYSDFYRDELITLVLLGIYGVIGIYHLLLFARRPRDIYNLYFGLFCLFAAIYWFFSTSTRDFVFAEEVLWRIKAEHAVLFLIAAPFLLFISNFFYDRHSKIGLIAAAFHGTLVLVVLFAGYEMILTVLSIWQISVLPVALYIMYFMVRAWWQGRPDAGYLILGILALMGSAIQDILANQGIIPTPQISRYFFVLFLPGIAGLLANRFTRVHSEAERLNEKLEEEVADRTRDLNSTLKELRFAKAETDDILHNVQEGLFLLSRQDDRFPIGGQHSSELAAILKQEDLSGADFREVMRPMIKAATMNGLDKYLAAMFDPKKKARVVNKLNPLARVEVVFPTGSAGHLEFHFSRVVRDDRIVQLMVTVKDVTRAVELARQLEISEARGRAAVERTQALLAVDPVMLADFIEDTETEYSFAAELLQSELSPDDLAELFRSLHSIKGNANLLNLTFIGDIAHDLEAHIEELQQTAADPTEIRERLAPEMDELGEALGEMRQWIQRITDFQTNFGQATTRQGEYFIGVLRETIQRLAVENGKEIELKSDGFDYGLFPRAKQKQVRDAIAQLVRNAVAHGIETPAARRQSGKEEAGSISISTGRAEGKVQLVVRDNGSGIKIEELRQKALESGRWSPETVRNWSDRELAGLIFTAGISTAEKADLQAGRGIGMDLLKKRWEAIGGQVVLAFKPGTFTEFRLLLPEEQ